MLPLEDLTVNHLLRRSAARFPTRPAVEYGAQVYSYQALDEAVNLMACRLLHVGIGKGTHVGVWCETHPDTICLLYALARIGAVGALLNTSLQQEELKQLLQSSDIRYLVIGDGYKDLDYPSLCAGLTEELPELCSILYMGPSDCPHGFLSLERVPPTSEALLSVTEQAVSPTDTAFLLYTSGTTSLPKAVMGSHYSRANSAIQQADDLGATEQDRFCVAMPIFHCFSLSVNMLAACAVGACLCLPSSRRTGPLLETISHRRCTVFSSVPTLYHAIMNRPDFKQWDLSSLRTGFIGGNLYTPDLFREITNAFAFTLLPSLGQTEATAGITVASPDDPLVVRASTLGHFMSHVEGKIVSIENGISLPAHQTGEICVRGYVVMQGYYGQPEATAKAVDADGWLHTGDLGYLDDCGNLHMTGRLKELIIRGGENISPAEIEAVLAGDTRIRACKAVGVPDDHYGEEVCLCVELQADTHLSEHQLHTILTQRLARFKVPRYILFLNAFPKTATGKIRTAELMQIVCLQLGLSACQSQQASPPGKQNN